ncbi:ORF29 [Silurid herpesvirus 1]|nr:ORF29 [Silurid herpesvirus 1]
MTQLNGDIFDGVQLTILLDEVEKRDRCLVLVPGGRATRLHDSKTCGICARKKPDRSLFAAYFAGLPEEDHIRSRHFQFFNDFGYLMRPAELDAYTTPIIAPMAPGVVECIVIYNKVQHIPAAALKPLLALDAQYEWNTITQQLRIHTPKIQTLNTESRRSTLVSIRDVATSIKRKRCHEDSDPVVSVDSAPGWRGGSLQPTAGGLRESLARRIQ